MASKRYISSENIAGSSERETALGLSDTPKVSIGLPVYNGANTIRQAITAILGQTFPDFELIIADNASTDNTLEICEATARPDARIRIIRQERNGGAIANFASVLKEARGQFFMFAAADDWIEPHFIEETLAALEAAPEAVACAPRTLMHFEGEGCREARGTAPVEGPAWWRPARFLLRPSDNSRFYGLYRTEVLRAAYLSDRRFHAFDWAVSALTLASGAHVRSRSIILHRSGTESDKYHRELLRDEAGLLARLFPVARMSGVLLTRLGPSQLPLATPALLLLNARKCAEFLLASVRGRLRA